MIVADEQIVGGVELKPAEGRAAPQRDPGVRGVRAFEPLLTGSRQRAQIAADVVGRQAESAQSGDHDMGEILANAAAARENLGERRRDLGRLRIIGEIGVDAPHQIEGRFENRPPLRKTFARIGGDRLQQRRQPPREQKMRRRLGVERFRCGGVRAHGLPGRGQRGGGRGSPPHRDARFKRDAQPRMRRVDPRLDEAIAEKVEPLSPPRRFGRQLDGASQHALTAVTARAQSQRAARRGNRRGVAVSRHVADVVDHPSWDRLSGRCLSPPARK